MILGYSFSDINDYKEAKQEAQTIEYIRKNTDLNNKHKVLKLYHQLVERNSLRTIVGYDFLKELRDSIIRDGLISKENLPNIPVVNKTKAIKTGSSSTENNLENKHKLLMEDYKIRHRNSRIINCFFIVIIVGILLINIFSNRSIFQKYEETILNKYAAWEEDLQTREEALQQKELTQFTE